ncbi:uncharacterized protein ACIBXB_004577 isoform 1-T1 [Morphnus guianensis]
MGAQLEDVYTVSQKAPSCHVGNSSAFKSKKITLLGHYRSALATALGTATPKIPSERGVINAGTAGTRPAPSLLPSQVMRFHQYSATPLLTISVCILKQILLHDMFPGDLGPVRLSVHRRRNINNKGNGAALLAPSNKQDKILHTIRNQDHMTDVRAVAF